MEQKWKKLGISLGIPLGVGALAGWITAGKMEAFGALAQPPLSPPGWLFPVVWTVLYGLMGYAAFRVCRSGDYQGRSRAMTAYSIQLGANFLWPLMFFGMQWFGISLAWILILWALVLWTILRFFRVDRVAGYLLLPYLLWISFAIYLNWGIYRLNG